MAASMSAISTGIFQDALNASPIGIALENMEGQPLFVNPALCRMLGLTEEEMLRKHCVEFSPAEDAAKDWALFQQLRAGHIDHYQIDKRYFRRDGSLVWGRLTVTLLKSDSSPLLFAMVEDITDRKVAEEALRESEERFRLVADSAPVMIWISGPDKLCIYVNQPWLDFTGRSLEQELGNGWVESIHPDDVTGCFATYSGCFDRREKFMAEYRLRRYDGQYRWVLDSGKPKFNHDGSFAGYIGSAVDVTERKIMEDALHASEERLRLAQQAARMGTFETNIRTGTTTWTPELEAVYGLPAGCFPKTRQAFFDLIHPEDRKQVRRLDDSAIKSGQPTRGEWRTIWPDGSVHWVSGRWRVFRDEHGEPGRIIGVNSDITERKQAEATLLEMQRKLLQAQEEERARIGRELHDDINQQLAMVTFEVDQLQRHCPKAPVERSNRLNELREHLIEISGGVQSLSRQLHPSQLEYLGVTSAMRIFCRDFGVRQRFAISFDADDIGRSVPSDVSLCLLRVLQEAVHNAAKYSQVRDIEVRLRRVQNDLCLTVSDQGRGFDESTINKGSLGLVSMRERVRLIGGTISINSQEGRGTIIKVCVPLD